jgi:hypothetical protein
MAIIWSNLFSQVNFSEARVVHPHRHVLFHPAAILMAANMANDGESKLMKRLKLMRIQQIQSVWAQGAQA